MSQVLNQRVFACGREQVSVAAGAEMGFVQIDVTGYKKTTDTVLLTFDWNNQSDIQLTAPLAVYNATDGSNFIVAGSGVFNSGGSAVNVFINWAVLR
jgi:hypothetical protein